jgi:cellulase
MNPKPNSPAWTGPGYGQGGVPPDKFAVVKFLTLLLCKVRRRLITIIQSNIICHDDAKPGNINVEVNAGSTIQIQWTKWADSHHGPVIDYLAPCVGPCTSASPQSLKFTKIAESGLVKAGPPNSYVFATDVMIKNNNTWTVKIPAGLKSGEYVLRNEIIALHAAGTVGGSSELSPMLQFEGYWGWSINITSRHTWNKSLQATNTRYCFQHRSNHSTLSNTWTTTLEVC